VDDDPSVRNSLGVFAVGALYYDVAKAESGATAASQLSRTGPGLLVTDIRRFPITFSRREKQMLWLIFVILLVLWLLGFSFHVAGGLIHLLLIIAVVVLVINLISGRRTA
jgi:hypothetical protein